MITVFRRNQRILLLFVAIVTIIAFAFLPEMGLKRSDGTVAKIYGKNLSQAEIDKLVRYYQLSLAMGQYEFISDLGGMAGSDEQAIENFVWNLQVADHETKALGVQATDQQVTDLLKTAPAFQGDGGFDPKKYAMFVERQLGPRGLTEYDLEKVAGHAVATSALKKIIVSPAAVSEPEVTEAMRVLQKIDLQFVRFPLPDPATITVSSDEVTAYFEKSKAILRAPETRAVEYVEFALPADQTALTGKEKVDAQQKVADAAANFAEKAAAAPSLGEAAREASLTVQQTPDFSRQGAAATPSAQGVSPDQQQAFLSGLAPATFLLSEEHAVSDVVQEGDKFFVLRLLRTTPERDLTIEEARPEIEGRLRMEKLAAAAKEQAEATVLKLRDEVAAGRSLAEAGQALNLPVETLSGIEPTRIQPTAGIPIEAIRTSLLLQPGQMSGLIPTQQGYAAAFLAARAPLDLPAEELATQTDSIKTELLEGKQTLLFLTWLAAQRDAAGITVAPR